MDLICAQGPQAQSSPRCLFPALGSEAGAPRKGAWQEMTLRPVSGQPWF